MNQGSVEEAVKAINFGCGFGGGLLLGLIGGLGAVVAAQRLGLPPLSFCFVWLGVGLTLWASCFVWHAYRASRALEKPSPPIVSRAPRAQGGPLPPIDFFARRAAWAIGLPATIAALLVALYLGWGAIAPALKARGIDVYTFALLIVVVGAVIVPVVCLTGVAIYRAIWKKRVKGGTTEATTAPAVPRAAPPSQVQPSGPRRVNGDRPASTRAAPPSQIQPSGAAERESALLDYLLSLCHNDRALCERLIEQARGLHPHLPREDLLELVIDNFRADNR
jgi:hypothetical protein